MGTTILKIKNFRLYTEGSMVDPDAHIWFTNPRSKSICRGEHYSGLNIFPSIFKSHRYIEGTDPAKYKRIYYFRITNQTPKILKWWFGLKRGYHNECWGNVDVDYETGKMIKLKDPTFWEYFIMTIKRGYKIKHCNHEWEVESHISPDSGSEDIYCPKCGYFEHICYY